MPLKPGRGCPPHHRRSRQRHGCLAQHRGRDHERPAGRPPVLQHRRTVGVVDRRRCAPQPSRRSSSVGSFEAAVADSRLALPVPMSLGRLSITGAAGATVSIVTWNAVEAAFAVRRAVAFGVRVWATRSAAKWMIGPAPPVADRSPPPSMPSVSPGRHRTRNSCRSRRSTAWGHSSCRCSPPGPITGAALSVTLPNVRPPARWHRWWPERPPRAASRLPAASSPSP